LKKRISNIWFTGCGGCTHTFLDLGEKLFSLMDRGVDFVYYPMLIDKKEFEEIDIAFVEGGIRSKDEERTLRKLRKKASTLVACGMCAVDGGVSSLGNLYSLKELYDTIMGRVDTVGKTPSLENPMFELTERLKPIDYFVDVDYYVRGCPPPRSVLGNVLSSLVEGREPDRFTSIVCNQCTRKIIGKKAPLSRGLGRAPDPEICLLDQGYLCLGSITRNGCGAVCTLSGMPCIGCRGPSDYLYKRGDLMSAVIRILSARMGEPKENVEQVLGDVIFAFYSSIFRGEVARTRKVSRFI
jgi:F420-non-reducing hydrogenase small subunit